MQKTLLMVRLNSDLRTTVAVCYRDQTSPTERPRSPGGDGRPHHLETAHQSPLGVHRLVIWLSRNCYESINNIWNGL
jgi:hypothetical protein